MKNDVVQDHQRSEEIAPPVSETDRLWGETPDGIAEIKLRGTLKLIDRIMSGLKSRKRYFKRDARIHQNFLEASSVPRL